MQTAVFVIVALLSVVPALWRLWQRRGTLGKRHLAVFGAMAVVGGIVLAVFGPMVRDGGWVPWARCSSPSPGALWR